MKAFVACLAAATCLEQSSRVDAFAFAPKTRALSCGTEARRSSRRALSMSATEGGEGLNRGQFGKTMIASTAAVALGSVAKTSPAAAAGLSSGSGSRVNKDPISLLRLGLPIKSKPLRALQEATEGVKSDILLKTWSRGISGCQKARSILKSKKTDILAAVREDSKAQAQKIIEEVGPQIDLLESILASKEGTGTVAERAKLDSAYDKQTALSAKIGELLELAVPAGYAEKLEKAIPDEYDDLPRLLGRATVEFVLVKPGKGEKFDIEGKLYDEAKLTMVLDGYTAPITCGNIFDLIEKGFYNKLPVVRSDGFVVQTGDPEPEGAVDGYIPSGSSSPRIIPLEVFFEGDDAPIYSATSEDVGRGGAAAKLPFQAYGALGMARTEFETDSASSQFFWLLFESDLTPAGKNLLDGRYTEFGYTVDGEDLLKDVKEGDIIKSAKVLSGKEFFKAKK